MSTRTEARSYAYVDRSGDVPVLGSPWPGRELARVRRTVRQAGTLPLALVLAAQWWFVVALGLPETSVLPASGWWRGQLDALSFFAHPASVTVLLLVSAALALGVRRGQRLGRLWIVVPAAVGVVVAVGVLLGRLASGLGGSTLAVLVLLVWLASVVWAAGHAVLAGLAPRRPMTTRTGAVIVAAWIVLLPGPLALGRLLLAPDLRTEAALLAGNSEALRFAALLTGASVRLYLFGALLGLAVWLGYQCVPRAGVRRPWRWYAVLVVTLIVLMELWWTAQTAASVRVTQLRYGAPGADLRFTCARWVYPPASDAPASTPTQTIAISGTSCQQVTTYDGYRQLGTTDTHATLSSVALRSPAPAGSEELDESDRPVLGRTTAGPAGDPKPLVGARYGDVVVLAGSKRFDRTADQLVAVSVQGGEPLWHFTCGEKGEVRATFAGGQPDPASDVTVPGSPGDAVVLTCAGERLRLDPVTGLTAAR